MIQGKTADAADAADLLPERRRTDESICTQRLQRTISGEYDACV